MTKGSVRQINESFRGCSNEQVPANRLHHAFQKLTEAILEVENEIAAMKADHDPLASHIFVSRRQYRNANDTKSGKSREVAARLSYNQACELGFRWIATRVKLTAWPLNLRAIFD